MTALGSSPIHAVPRTNATAMALSETRSTSHSEPKKSGIVTVLKPVGATGSVVMGSRNASESGEHLACDSVQHVIGHPRKCFRNDHDGSAAWRPETPTASKMWRLLQSQPEPWRPTEIARTDHAHRLGVSAEVIRDWIKTFSAKGLCYGTPRGTFRRRTGT